MIGIIVVTHGRLAKELIAATEHVVGPMDGVGVVCVGASDDLQERREALASAIAGVDRGQGVVVVTDMFGSTPGNLAVSFMKKGRVEVVAGANLPMMIRLVEARESLNAPAAAEAAREAGRRYISVANGVARGGLT